MMDCAIRMEVKDRKRQNNNAVFILFAFVAQSYCYSGEKKH